MSLLGFKGDLSWVHAQEDFKGAKSCYWPSGQSGVTLRPGVDIGYTDVSLLEEHYKPRLTAEQWKGVQRAIGVKGIRARDLLAKDAALNSIRISYADGVALFDLTAAPYWAGICKKYPSLRSGDVPGVVHTAFLSLSFNRGWGNKDLRQLATPLEAKEWAHLADLIGKMQQNHQLSDIRSRRREEADLIRAYLSQNKTADEVRSRLLRPELKRLQVRSVELARPGSMRIRKS